MPHPHSTQFFFVSSYAPEPCTSDPISAALVGPQPAAVNSGLVRAELFGDSVVGQSLVRLRLELGSGWALTEGHAWVGRVLPNSTAGFPVRFEAPAGTAPQQYNLSLSQVCGGRRWRGPGNGVWVREWERTLYLGPWLTSICLDANLQ